MTARLQARTGRGLSRTPQLVCEELEARETPAVTATLVASTGVLTVTADASGDRVRIYEDGTNIAVLGNTVLVGEFPSASVTSITVNATGGNNSVIVDNAVLQPTTLTATSGTNKLVAGGGPAMLTGGSGTNELIGGLSTNAFNGGGVNNTLLRVQPSDIVFPNAGNQELVESPISPPPPPALLSTSDVSALLSRAAAASAANNAIIVVVDRTGQILGVRVESGVSSAITSNPTNLVFAIDGAYAEALTGAYFANNQAPLTSRTVQFISQSTITQQEVDSNPDIANQNSTLYGPGAVAPVEIGGHFPPGIALTPTVDLAQIEFTNRDQSEINGVPLSSRFNINLSYVPAGNELYAPDSYGLVSGLLPTAQSRGIGTLPGGVPIYKDGNLVGGIGVFFPGTTGYATEENSSLSSTYDPSKPDLSLEAEWMAFAAVGGNAAGGGALTALPAPIGTLGGVPLPAGIAGLPSGRIDLVGITLPVIGPGNPQNGLAAILAEGQAVGQGNPNDGINEPVDTTGDTLLNGRAEPSGWLVLPHSGVGITQQQVEQIITQGITQADLTRAAIRLPAGVRAQFVFAVTDQDGNVVGLYRQPDATVFSIDVAVAKARNVEYYDNPTQIQPEDVLPGIPAGTSFTARTFRYLQLPLFPEGIDGSPPGPWSVLNDGGANPLTGLMVGAPLPPSAFQSVEGYAAFHPVANFHDPNNPLNQNGIVFFPGSSAIYDVAPDGASTVVGGLGVSGDGVDEDDVTTQAAATNFGPPSTVLRADEVSIRGVNLPYAKFDRNPEG